MTGEKRTDRNKNGMLTLCLFPMYHSTLPACIVYDCREDRGVIIGNTQSVSISHSCFCSFFTSHPYILSKDLQNVFIY